MAYCNIELEFQYEDRTTSKLVIGPYKTDSLSITGLKTNVKDFNSDKDGAIAFNEWGDLVVNENGSKLIAPGGTYPNTPILNAAIIATEETVLF